MTQAIKRPDPSIAAQALAEAQARQATREVQKQALAAPKELGGRGGEDPARYGDWEVKGIACDF